MRIDRLARGAVVAFACLAAGNAGAAPAALRIDLTGRAEVVFDTARNPCPGFAMPDINPRAFRDASGQTILFALDQSNQPLAGPSLGQAKPTCRSALPSGENANPATFDGRRYLTSAWTSDGRAVAGLVHDEYHAETHPGRCASKASLACWYNAVIAVRSGDGGQTFAPASPLVVAAPPFRQDFDQTRHRGFFNPSNMFNGPGGIYAFASTTGWDGQSAGACLLRNPDPRDPAGWRGWDGRGFNVRWSDPYAGGKPVATPPCVPVRPFGFPVGSVVRHRSSGLYVGLWEQPKIEGETPFGVFPVAGFYIATSRDLLQWSDPTLVLPAAVIHQACGPHGENKNGVTLAYPALLDQEATGRNYDNVGDVAWLYFTQIKMEGCDAGARRMLMRRPIAIKRDAGRP